MDSIMVEVLIVSENLIDNILHPERFMTLIKKITMDPKEDVASYC
jgi:hypothetical protein